MGIVTETVTERQKQREDVDFKVNIHLDSVLHIMLVIVSKVRKQTFQLSSRTK